MTFYEINEAVKEEMQLDPGLISDAERIRFINDCSGEIAQLHLLEASSVGDTVLQYPTMPTNLLKIQNMFWEGTEIKPLPSGYDFDSTGVPVGYIFEGGSYRLFPAPEVSGELKIIYNMMPYLMDADMLVEASAGAFASTPGVPLGWDMLYINYAAHRSHRKNGNILMSREYESAYTKSLGLKVRDYIARLNSKPVMGESKGTLLHEDSYAALSGILD